MSEFKPILPGTSDYSAALKTLKELKDQKPLEISFTEIGLGKTGATLKHTIVAQDDSLSKIVILITRAAQSVMIDVSTKLRVLVEELNIAGTNAEAGVSPLINKQYDFVLFNVPNFQAPMVRNHLVNSITRIYS